MPALLIRLLPLLCLLLPLSARATGLTLYTYHLKPPFVVDELAQTSQLTRENAESEEQNLRKLLAGHVDATIVSESTLHYLREHGQLAWRQLPSDPEWQAIMRQYC